METYAHDISTEPAARRPEHLTGGIILVVLGLLFLLAQFVDLGWLMLPILGAGFLLTGIVRREAGWLIPGGILAGLSLGILLTDSPYRIAGEPAQGGLFMLAFALGWVSIAVLSKLFTSAPQWWALIPGGIMAVIGLAALGMESMARLLELAGYLWPVGLIVAGLYFILRRGKAELRG